MFNPSSELTQIMSGLAINGLINSTGVPDAPFQILVFYCRRYEESTTQEEKDKYRHGIEMSVSVLSVGLFTGRIKSAQLNIADLKYINDVLIDEYKAEVLKNKVLNEVNHGDKLS